MAKKDGMYCYYDWLKPLERVPAEDFKELFISMLKYSRDGEEPPEFDGLTGMAADFIFPQIARSKMYAEIGKKGGESTQANTNGSTNGSTLIHKPILQTNTGTNTDTSPPTPSKGESDERFTEFWEEYPRKEGKQNARKAWDKLCPDEELLYRILDAIALQKESDQWTRDGGRYIPLPASWLNGKRWEDEVKLATAMSFYDMLKDA